MLNNGYSEKHRALHELAEIDPELYIELENEVLERGIFPKTSCKKKIMSINQEA